MFSQKVAQQSLRRLAVQQPFAMRSMMGASPVAVALGKNMQTRQVASSSNTEDPSQILVKQRLARPVAPHLSIYKPQIGWIGSSLHRITGVALSGTLYLWATAYLVSPALGWHLESASMVAAMGALPFAAKVLLKSTLALPFTYHCMNGLRHLMWDLGRGLTNPVIIKTGWAVVGLSITSAIGLALI
ncbi:Succinate dehydrogenase/Fumarate reductase, transmembrane subunit [Penicillium griseofulvum]|uniref:Succinate dehydrogenase/Fumarate reductase, transmembrane subunit n=1 Tax=Penicillium patulum TaxID=5078 RepID=A0A135LME5_PENPA|nr:Succinate dehydrogenase/Fumarate reductase, transmembrane subunit [Penicillium griseofulvum]KXG50104.1 Succinate dehydrogenase/Fumarate reductase, transmembrane subunit [Penicillium griseofulvum]